MAAKLVWLLLKERPDIVITTGAAPGYFCLRLGKLLGARTIWIDSICPMLNNFPCRVSGLVSTPTFG